MFKATEETFLRMLTSGKVIEVYVYCEPNIVYYWKGVDKETGNLEVCYLVCPETASRYRKFVEKLKKECPLLLELM